MHRGQGTKGPAPVQLPDRDQIEQRVDAFRQLLAKPANALTAQRAIASIDTEGRKLYAMVMAPTIAICLASYHAFVRYTFIGSTLNGKRERPVAAPVSP